MDVPTSPAAQISILFLAAEPIDEPALTLTMEFERIRDELRILYPGRFVIESKWHTQATDLPRLVMDHRPHVLHFSGHGQVGGELVFESPDGGATITDARAVARVFELLRGPVRCVLLNACYSEAQAQLLAEHVDVVIGMSNRIRNRDATRFSKGFYEALSRGKSMGQAFELAKVGMWLDGSDGQDIPRLHARPGVDPGQVFLVDRTEVAERPSPKYLFVAHARGDKLRVAKLCRGLLDLGVRPWFDLWDLHRSPGWQSAMHAVLRQAPAVLLVDGPAGAAVDNAELGEVLRERIEREPGTVHRVGLPGASPGEGLTLTDASWTEDLGKLAEQIGVDHDRRSWLELESRLSDGDPTPYRGLRAFGEGDARWMFGRDDEIADLLARVEAGMVGQSRFLTVIGASGSGKSSLVMGGLCPALRSGVLEGGPVWKLATLRPGSRPCEALAAAVVDLQIEFGAKADAIADADRIAALHKQLLEGSNALRLVLRRICSAGRGDRSSARMLLVADQLEELFTEAGLGGRDESSDAMAFVRNLIEATNDPDVPLWVVSTLRADFIPSCLAVGELARTLNAGIYFALPPMREQQIREAVELPARRLGFEVEPRLLTTLVAGAAEQAARLPLLEHMLRELWQHRDEKARALRFAAYQQAGGLEGAIAAAAEATLARLSRRLGDRATAVTRRVMARLVRLGEGTQGDTRRRATLDQLGRDEETRVVLSAFVQEARVLVGDREGGVEVVEIAHEALLREWTTLVGWLNADREALRLRQELGAAAKVFRKKQNVDYLWGRSRVEEARRMLAAARSVELDAHERAFLEASDRAARAQIWTIRGALGTTFAVLVGVLVYIVGLNAENRRQAEENKVQADENARQADENAKLADEYAKLAKSESLARRESEEINAVQKGLLASNIVANTGSHIDAAIFAIEAVGSFGPERARSPSTAAYQGLLAVMGAKPVLEVATLEGHSAPLEAVTFSPDGKRLATTGDKSARLWDTATGKPLLALEGHSGLVEAVAFSPDGSRIATASRDGTARLWGTTSGTLLASLQGHSAEVTEVAFSPDGSRIATASHDNTARLWDAASGEPLAVLEGHHGIVVEVAFSPDGSRIATGSWDGTARLWNTASGQLLAALECASSRVVEAVAFSPDGKRIAAASSWDKTACLWDAASGKRLASLEGHLAFVTAVAFSPDGSRIATASDDETARLWDAASGKLLAALEGHSAFVTAVAFSPDGSHLATASNDKTARLWDAASGKLLASLQGHSGDVTAVAFSPDGSRIATGSADKTVRLWDATSDQLLASLKSFSGNVNAVALSPDGSRMAAASSDGTARLLDMRSGKLLVSIEGLEVDVVEIAVSLDGSRIATASRYGLPGVWDVASGQRLAHIKGHYDPLNAVVFSADGKRLATASDDDTACLWDAASGERLVCLEGHSDNVTAVAFSPDGNRLATASEDNTARVWDAASGTLLTTLEGHSGHVTAVAFSADGKRLATGSDDNTARLWDATSGQLLASLAGHSDYLTAVAFSPDGSRLATASEDNTACLWDVASGQLLGALEGHADNVTAVVFSADGARIITASADGAVRFWPTPELALELTCRQIQHAVRYPEVAEICDPLL